ncbi:amidohydrolase [Actinomadura chibensis]|uniref:Amidohydrolase n=1 Tax=Actinomadura chibensis TaxID=392828 RepID=A0A5D0N9J0_9ACTN|nr:amidohydrolase [Actinomadura chibensis]TYB41093.1 amidohydrolase [Actinomadura chibensis]
MKLDTVFTNARITTLDPERPTARRLGVLGGRVAGLDEDLDGVTADRVVDLAGAPVVPGFNDAHYHLSAAGTRMLQMDLRADVVATLDELYRVVAEHAAGLPADAWVIGAGYDQNKLGAHPDRDRLDRACGGRPAFLQHCSGHLGVVSSAALARMGIGDAVSSTAIPGGTVDTDRAGRPTGLLRERAVEIAYHAAGPLTAERFAEAIGRAAREALAVGITSVTEPGIGTDGLLGNNCADLAAFVRARDTGVLRVRTNVMPVADVLHEITPFEADRPWFGLDLGLASGFGDERLKVGAVKFMVDGSLVGRTACLTSPYADRPGESGDLREERRSVIDRIVRAHEFGWQVAAHAIGDAAIDVVLDACERAGRLHPRRDPRHRIEHCAVTRPDQLARLAGLGVIPVPQGRFVSELGDGMIRALGTPRSEWCYRGRSFLDAGLVLPGSSDCPVVNGEPLLGMHDLVNRTTSGGRTLGAAERLTPLEALRAFTVGSAFAAREETSKGTLARGKLADLVVLSDDVLQVGSGGLAAVTVGATVVGGEVEYDAGAVARDA